MKIIDKILDPHLRPIRDSIEHLVSRIDVLRSSVDSLLTPTASHIVIWGRSVNDRNENVRENVFSIDVVRAPGDRSRAKFQPQCPFKMTRWLYLGSGQVREIYVGSVVHNPTGDSVIGISGKYGEGNFLTADTGSLIQFEIES